MPTPREPTFCPFGVPTMDGRESARHVNHKRRLRASAWRWLLCTTLLTGQAGSQGPRSSAIPAPTEVEAAERISQTGPPRYRGPGSPAQGGYRLYFTDSAGSAKFDGLITAVRMDWLPSGAMCAATEVLEGQILSVRVKSPMYDFLLMNAYAPVSTSNTPADSKLNRTFCETLNPYLAGRPARTTPIMGGDFNAHVGEHVDTPSVGRCGGTAENANGTELRELAEQAGLLLPLTFLRAPHCGWTWQRSDGPNRPLVNSWRLASQSCSIGIRPMVQSPPSGGGQVY